MADTVHEYGDDGSTGEYVTVKHPDPEALSGGRDTMRIRADRYDSDVHELAEGEDPPSSTDEDTPDPDEALVDLVGGRRANALARAGLTTIEGALAYHDEDGDLTDLDGVGDGTLEALLSVR